MGVVCNVEDAPDDDEIMIDNDYMEDQHVEQIHHDDVNDDLVEEVHAGRRDIVQHVNEQQHVLPVTQQYVPLTTSYIPPITTSYVPQVSPYRQVTLSPTRLNTHLQTTVPLTTMPLMTVPVTTTVQHVSPVKRVSPVHTTLVEPVQYVPRYQPVHQYVVPKVEEHVEEHVEPVNNVVKTSYGLNSVYRQPYSYVQPQVNQYSYGVNPLLSSNYVPVTTGLYGNTGTAYTGGYNLGTNLTSSHLKTQQILEQNNQVRQSLNLPPAFK